MSGSSSMSLSRVDRNGVSYESVVDSNLRWGHVDLTHEEVTTEIKLGLREPPDEITLPSLGKTDMPMRAKILLVIADERNNAKGFPWKTYLNSRWGGGWLVVTGKGWKFEWQENK